MLGASFVARQQTQGLGARRHRDGPCTPVNAAGEGEGCEDAAGDCGGILTGMAHTHTHTHTSGSHTHPAQRPHYFLSGTGSREIKIESESIVVVGLLYIGD